MRQCQPFLANLIHILAGVRVVLRCEAGEQGLGLTLSEAFGLLDRLVPNVKRADFNDDVVLAEHSEGCSCLLVRQSAALEFWFRSPCPAELDESIE